MSSLLKWLFLIFIAGLVIYFADQTISLRLLQKNSPPVVNGQPNARSYIVFDASQDKILSEKNSDVVRPIASITKLLTAVVSGQKIRSGMKLTYNETFANSIFAPGEQISFKDGLSALLMESNNETAYAISDLYGPVNIIKDINYFSHSIGMTHTTITDPAGLDETNRSSPKDLVVLGQYLYQKRPDILQITKTPELVVRTDDGIGGSGSEHRISNLNAFSHDPRFIGGKIGYTTEAGQTMIALFNIKRNGGAGDPHLIIIVILGSRSREQDVGLLLQKAIAHLNFAI